MDITHSSWKITKLHYAKVYDERDHRREGADGLDAVPESRLKECLQKGWVTDRMSPTDESERLFGVERGGGESEFCDAENIVRRFSCRMFIFRTKLVGSCTCPTRWQDWVNVLLQNSALFDSKLSLQSPNLISFILRVCLGKIFYEMCRILPFFKFRMNEIDRSQLQKNTRKILCRMFVDRMIPVDQIFFRWIINVFEWHKWPRLFQYPIIDFNFFLLTFVMWMNGSICCHVWYWLLNFDVIFPWEWKKMTECQHVHLQKEIGQNFWANYFCSSDLSPLCQCLYL